MSRRHRRRGRDELLVELEERRRIFLTFSPENRKAIDEARMVPTLELHDILNSFLMTGKFADE